VSDTPTIAWHNKLVAGFRRTSERLGDNLQGLFTKERLDRETLDEIEEALIASDLGPATAARVRERLEDERYEKDLDEAGVRAVVADEVAKILRPVAKPLEIEAFPRPQVILVIGVNGSGKTTTIAKLAHLLQEQDYQVMLVAGDTFRAAAIGQLKVWAERIGVPIISGAEGGDAASLVWEGVKQGTAIGTDVLIVDTAGRLQNKAGLMDELSKIRRVLGRLNPAAPHDVVLVLDATTGQNAINQIEVFGKEAGVTGLVMTKLDGTAKGGVLVAAAEKFGLPIHAIGVGETLEDFRPFDADEVAGLIAGSRNTMK
jgi:fused signal recognition particle receptor